MANPSRKQQKKKKLKLKIQKVNRRKDLTKFSGGPTFKVTEDPLVDIFDKFDNPPSFYIVHVKW